MKECVIFTEWVGISLDNSEKYHRHLNLFHLTFVRIVLMVLHWPQQGVWRMCPSTSWQRHAKLRQEIRLIRKRDGISCDHSGASTHSLSHRLITHIALPWRSPGMILSVKVHSWAKRHISPCKGNDYQRTAKDACHHLRMERMRRHWGEWYSHCYAPMFPARMLHFLVTHVRWCGYKAIFAPKSTFGTVLIWNREKNLQRDLMSSPPRTGFADMHFKLTCERCFVSLCNTRWQSHRPTHSTFIYRIGMMLLTVLRFFVFIPTPNPRWSRPEHNEDESLKRYRHKYAVSGIIQIGENGNYRGGHTAFYRHDSRWRKGWIFCQR